MALGIASGEAAQDDKIGRAGPSGAPGVPGAWCAWGSGTRVRRVGALPGLLMLVLRLRACCVQVLCLHSCKLHAVCALELRDER